MIKKIKYLIPSLAYGLPLAVFAQRQKGEELVKDIESVFTKIDTMMNYFLSFVLLVAVIMIIYAGFSFMTAAGDAEKIKSAKSALTYAIIGIAVAVLAFSVKAVVMSLVK